MAGNRGRSDSEKVRLFSPEERQEVLDRTLTALRTDSRIAGVVVVGSGAVGFDDIYSDIDLSVVVASENNTLPVFREWKQRIEELFTVIQCFEVTFAPNNHLLGFLLDGYLELDVGFLCLANLSARRARWKVAFDRSARIEEIMRSSWEKRTDPDVRADYVRRANSIWHYVIHVAVALERAQPWRALYYLGEIRKRTIELAGLSRGLDTGDFREVDRLPREFLAELQRALVSSLDGAEIMRALKVVTACFFRESRGLDEMLGLDLARRLEPKMQEYLELRERKKASGNHA